MKQSEMQHIMDLANNLSDPILTKFLRHYTHIFSEVDMLWLYMVQKDEDGIVYSTEEYHRSATEATKNTLTP
jgi:hypothetical protein